MRYTSTGRLLALVLGLSLPAGLALAQEGGAPPPAQTASGGNNENGPDPSGHAGAASQAEGGIGLTDAKHVTPTEKKPAPGSKDKDVKLRCECTCPPSE